MALVYKSQPGLTGYHQYAYAEREAQWWRRGIYFNRRTGSEGAPLPWTAVRAELNAKLVAAIDPGNPPETVLIETGTRLHRLHGLSVRLPKATAAPLPAPTEDK